MTFGTFIRLIP